MIKQSTKIILGESVNTMQGRIAEMCMYLSQICVKHEAFALMPVEVECLGNIYKIEEVADAMYGEGEENDDKMYVYPKSTEYFTSILEAIMKAHPEWKVDVLSETVDPNMAEEKEEKKKTAPHGFSDVEDTDDSSRKKKKKEEKYYYLLLTMPEVNKDRRDIYLDTIGKLYDWYKVKMDADKAALDARLALHIPKTYTNDDDAGEVKDAAEKLYNDSRDNLLSMRKDKEKEVEEGYQRYLRYNKGGDSKQSSNAPRPFSNDMSDDEKLHDDDVMNNMKL